MNKAQSYLPRFFTEARALLALSMPIIISQLAIQGMSFVDTSMAGQASARDLAAIAVAASLWMPVNLLMRGTLMALTPIVAHHRGAGTEQRIPADLSQTLWIALFSSVILIVYLNIAGHILSFMDVDSAIIPIATGYLYALSFGVPGIAIYFTLNSLCEGMGNTRAPMVVAIAGLLVNVPVNYVLIYGKLGLPALGAVGCGWATSLVYCVMSLLMILYLKSHHRYTNLLPAGNQLKMIGHRIGEQLKLGIPIGITIFIEGSIFAIIALLIGQLGATAVAAHQIALNFSGLTFMVPLSISFGITIRVGHAIGANNLSEAKLRTLSGTILGIMFATITAVCILLFPEAIIRVYTTDPVVAQGAALLLVYAAVYQISDSLQASANGALRGFKDTRTPMILVSIAYWLIGLPIGYILGLTSIITQPMGSAGFWIGLVSGLTAAAIFLGTRLLIVIKRTEQHSVTLMSSSYKAST
ncbi:MATE family efflux transporter [Parendozoicomonas sp. Alg238-R29]|uniref:MATE family efflux transporter n=1 Tax=Parendozoicomonas sp. Alg238-R29 TaxID=2993446 RepID=UPI00248E664D|nr:MATE family efflux transporter [Parendozoicomonas sp. Alg238-R29]